MYTRGLLQISVGAVDLTPDGVFPADFTKLGEAYKDSVKFSQDDPEKTEFFEEGKSVPAVITETKKVPVFSCSIMNPDPKFLSDYLGGSFTAASSTRGSLWGYDGSEVVADKGVLIESKVGMKLLIPNAKIQAKMNAELSDKGLFLIDLTITPQAVTSGKAIYSEGNDKTS